MDNQKTLNIIAAGAFITIFGSVISKFITYFYRLIVGRFLGPEAYGQLSLALMALGIFNTLALLSLGPGLKQKIPQTASKIEQLAYVKSAYKMTLPFSLALSTILFFSSEFIAIQVFESPNLGILIKTLAFVPVFNSISYISVETFLAYKEPKYSALINQILQNLIQLITTGLLIFAGWQVLAAAIGWTVGAVTTSLLAFFLLWKYKFPDFFKIRDLEDKKSELLHFSLPLMLSGMIGTILGWTDTFFIGYFMNDAQVGFYNAALPTAILLTIPMKALGTVSLPSLSTDSLESKNKVRSTLKTMERWTLSAAFPGFILMALFSEEILNVLFGAEYIVSAQALVILSFGYFFSASTGRMGDIVKTYEKTDVLFKNTLAKFVLNIPLNIILIPEYGLVGAAAATTASIMVVNTLLLIEGKYLFDIHPFSAELFKPVLAVIFPLFLVYMVVNSTFAIVPIWVLIPSAIAFGLLYLISLAVLGGLKEEDKFVLIDLGSKIGLEDESEKLAKLICRG